MDTIYTVIHPIIYIYICTMHHVISCMVFNLQVV